MKRIQRFFSLLRARVGRLVVNGGVKPNDQLESNFFKLLPYDIRIKIYQTVIDEWDWGNRIHLIKAHRLGPFAGKSREWYRQSFELDGKGLICVPCKASLEDGDPANIGLNRTQDWPERHKECLMRDPSRVKSSLNMFLSCRRM
jgi:hypothetical protein